MNSAKICVIQIVVLVSCLLVPVSESWSQRFRRRCCSPQTCCVSQSQTRCRCWNYRIARPCPTVLDGCSCQTSLEFGDQFHVASGQQPVEAPTVAANVPPTGFVAAFNGQDLKGWFGQRDINPYKLKDLSEADRVSMLAEDNENMLEHWRVEDGAIVNDGQGVFLSTEKEYRDYELWIDYKDGCKSGQRDLSESLSANSDLGLYRRGRQVGNWR